MMRLQPARAATPRRGGLQPARATVTNDVDAYLDALAPKARRVLRRVRAIVKQIAPDAEAKRSYGIVGFAIGGRIALYVAGWTTHWSVYPATARLRAELGDALAPYLASKGTLKFDLDDAMPTHLVQRIVRALFDEAREQGAVKGRAKKAAKVPTAKRATAASPKKRTASATQAKAAKTKTETKTKTKTKTR